MLSGCISAEVCYLFQTASASKFTLSSFILAGLKINCTYASLQTFNQLNKVNVELENYQNVKNLKIFSNAFLISKTSKNEICIKY